MTAGANRILAMAAAVVIAASGPLGAAAPAFAQSSPRQTLNVQGADIRAFIQDISRTTGHTFIVDPRVTGTVTVTSDRALSRSELFEVFLSTLRANGLVVSPTASGAYRVSPAEGAAQGPSTVGSERFATEVFQIVHQRADAGHGRRVAAQDDGVGALHRHHADHAGRAAAGGRQHLVHHPGDLARR